CPASASAVSAARPPSSSATTSYPFKVRALTTKARTEGSSSATRMRAMGSLLLVFYRSGRLRLPGVCGSAAFGLDAVAAGEAEPHPRRLAGRQREARIEGGAFPRHQVAHPGRDAPFVDGMTIGIEQAHHHRGHAD